MAAILAPHVNAYKRLQPDMLNGYWANWGHDDRSVGGADPADPRRRARASSSERPTPPRTRTWRRPPILHAARLGVEHESGAAAAPAARRGAEHGVPHPAEPGGRARRARPPTTSWCDALGREMVEAFTILKRAEWERYLASGADPDTTEVTAWEIDYYLPFH